jgi:hypothetical protein
MPSGRRASSLLKVGLAHRQRQLAQIVAVDDQRIKGVELHRVIVFARMQRVEVGDAVVTEQHRSPSITNELFRLRRAASAIRG